MRCPQPRQLCALARLPALIRCRLRRCLCRGFGLNALLPSPHACAPQDSILAMAKLQSRNRVRMSSGGGSITSKFSDTSTFARLPLIEAAATSSLVDVIEGLRAEREEQRRRSISASKVGCCCSSPPLRLLFARLVGLPLLCGRPQLCAATYSWLTAPVHAAPPISLSSCESGRQQPLTRREDDGRRRGGAARARHYPRRRRGRRGRRGGRACRRCVGGKGQRAARELRGKRGGSGAAALAAAVQRAREREQQRHQRSRGGEREWRCRHGRAATGGSHHRQARRARCGTAAHYGAAAVAATAGRRGVHGEQLFLCLLPVVRLR